VPVSDAAARRAADWLAAWARAGLLGTDPEVVGFVADLIQFVGERTMKSKPELRKALAEIMELAKNHRDFANTDYERARWEKVLDLTDAALGNPTVADIQRFLRGAE
jgi:hypothetical protein